MIADIRLIAGREISEKLRNRGFLLFTAFMIVVLPGGFVLMGYLGGNAAETYSVATVGERSGEVARAAQQRSAATPAELTLRGLPSERAAKRAVREGDVDAAIVGGSRVITGGDPAPALVQTLQSSAQQLRSSQALRSAGVEAERVRAALDPQPLTVASTGEERDPRVMITAMIGSVLLFLALYLYGYWIAAGVVEEKSSRVIELVLAAVPPRRLLAGKVVGIGALALAQLSLLIALGIGVAAVTAVTLPPVTATAVVSVLVWFVAGFAFYSCVFAVAGSLVSKQEDLQYTQMPPMVLILGGYLVALQYAVGGLDVSLAHALAYLPPFAPMLMPMMSATGDVATWEAGLAALVTLAAAIGLVGVAARVYTGSVLRFGGRVRLREAW